MICERCEVLSEGELIELENWIAVVTRHLDQIPEFMLFWQRHIEIPEPQRAAPDL